MPALASPSRPSRAARGSDRLAALQAKQEAVRDLIEGRARLFEAAARFLSIQRQRPAANPLAAVAVCCDDESACRTVIGWAHLALSDRPEQAEALSSRLESELQEHLNRFGRVLLPNAQ
jgi:hypothetical protein